MPMWCPPTPPQGEDDVYIDVSMGFLYDWRIMSEAQLPPVYIKRENKRPRADTGHSPDGRRPIKIHRKEESVCAPRSLFERPSPALVKMRRDLKLSQKYRPIVRPPVAAAGIKPTPHKEPESVPEWTVTEDMALLQAVKSQGLPLNLVIVSPAHTPNWDLVSDLVNNCSRIYRSPRQCRNRYEMVILPREEGKVLYDTNQKKQKKTKGICKTTHKGGRLMRTSQLYEQDNNVSFTQAILAKHDNMKLILNKKTATPKRRYDDPNKNPKHAAVLSDHNINYDAPPSPMEIAMRRAERIAKEKQKSAPAVAAPAESVPGAGRLQVANKPAPSPPPGAAAPAPAPTSAPTPQVASVRTPQRVVQPDRIAELHRQRIVVASQQATTVAAKAGVAGTVTTGGKPFSQAQIQRLRQEAITRQMKVFHQHPTAIVQQQQQGTQQAGQVNKIVPVSVPTIQVAGTTQQRPQITQAVGGVKQPIARAMTDLQMNALLKRQAQAIQHKAATQQPVTQIFASQQQLQAVAGGSGERLAVSVSGLPATKAGPGALGAVGALPGQAPKLTTSQQLRQLQMQQQITMAQRKGQKVTQLTQVGGGTQVIVQAQGVHKALPPGVTMQQIQQVMRQNQARVLPRQTIQVVGSNVGQVRAAGSTGVGVAGHTQMILSQVPANLQRQPAPPTQRTLQPQLNIPPPDTQPKQ